MKTYKELPKNPTVTIGIPAYNEAENLVPLISTLLKQVQSGFVLEKIIVVSDGSTDSTLEKIKLLNSKLITMIDHHERKGKPTRVNELMSYSASDVLVQIDADVHVRDPRFIAKLIAPMKKDKRIFLTSGVAHPLPPETIVEKIVYTGSELWEKTIHSPGMSKMYFSEGQIRAMRKELYKELKFPKASAECVYPYLFNASIGHGFASVDSAIIYYRLPQTFRDYMKQHSRFLESQSIQEVNFGKKFTMRYYTVTNWIKLKTLAQSIVQNPIWISLYLVLLVAPKLSHLFHLGDKRGNWDIIQSTKQVGSKKL